MSEFAIDVMGDFIYNIEMLDKKNGSNDCGGIVMYFLYTQYNETDGIASHYELFQSKHFLLMA